MKSADTVSLPQYDADLPVARPTGQDTGYNLVTGMADDAIQHMQQLNAAAPPEKPFFVYYAPEVVAPSGTPARASTRPATTPA